jgi:uncharacterized protein (TIGR00369 family)
MTAEVPPGFEPHIRNSAVTDPWEPLYAKREGEAFSLGLRIAHSHCNARGLLHGGVISALADNAMGLACVTRMEGVSALTVSLSVDFLSVGRSGQWLEVREARTHARICRCADRGRWRGDSQGRSDVSSHRGCSESHLGRAIRFSNCNPYRQLTTHHRS